MTPLIDANQAMKDSMEYYTDMRRGIGTEQYRNTVAWIEGLIVQSQINMINCGRDKLPDMQVRLKQLLSLRSALVDPGGATTGFTFD